MNAERRSTDLLGRPLSGAEAELVEIYGRLRALAARDDVAPCVASNVRFALAAVFQAVNDLGVLYEPTDDVGV
ncbi:MAG TPA: hypothetical protein VEI02_16685 [Planctomycetota bacterium]|nr:hypothetical protein [Planctomycetota bacterium]